MSNRNLKTNKTQKNLREIQPDHYHQLHNNLDVLQQEQEMFLHVMVLHQRVESLKQVFFALKQSLKEMLFLVMDAFCIRNAL